MLIPKSNVQIIDINNKLVNVDFKKLNNHLKRKYYSFNAELKRFTNTLKNFIPFKIDNINLVLNNKYNITKKNGIILDIKNKTISISLYKFNAVLNFDLIFKNNLPPIYKKFYFNELKDLFEYFSHLFKVNITTTKPQKEQKKIEKNLEIKLEGLDKNNIYKLNIQKIKKIEFNELTKKEKDKFYYFNNMVKKFLLNTKFTYNTTLLQSKLLLRDKYNISKKHEINLKLKDNFLEVNYYHLNSELYLFFYINPPKKIEFDITLQNKTLLDVIDLIFQKMTCKV
jgi:hypothetical protein